MTPKNVRSRRIKLGMSVAELAKAFGVPVGILLKFEAGEVTLNDVEQYRPILDRLERQQRPCSRE